MPQRDAGGVDINAEDVAVYIRDVAEQLANRGAASGERSA